MQEYKKVETSYVNGWTVVSKTLLLSPEEEKMRLQEARKAFEQIAINRQNREEMQCTVK